jgi:SAM-dependent methyltransferase
MSLAIPIPPLELRRMVGPTDAEAFDNPTGRLVYAECGLTAAMYESVLDFGCGCGRLARQLLQQHDRPRRYVGVDVHRGMIEWCQQNLSPVDPNFRFLHHDVWAPGYAPGNTLQLAQPFPVGDGEISLFFASSVFTHLLRRQTEYYLHEIKRILAPEGVAFTTWFFFDRDSFPFLHDGPFALFTGETDPAQAVIYDRRWFLDAVRDLGLGVIRTIRPPLAGHQWVVMLTRRAENMVDEFPLGEQDAEWLCGATAKPTAAPAIQPEAIEKRKVANVDSLPGPVWPQLPALFGPLAELAAMREELERLRTTQELERLTATQELHAQEG